MTCTICPNCGWSLAALAPIKLGSLFIDRGGAHVWWQKNVVPLTTSERLLVISLARAEGAPIKREILAETVGYDGDEPENLVAVLTSKARGKFRNIDPLFDQIETVRGSGLRWAV